MPTHSGQQLTQVDRLDTDPSLSSAANPIPSIYLAGTEPQLITPETGIAGTSSEETVEAIDASQLKAQPIGALTADSDDVGGPLLEANDPNDPNFPLQFMNFPTGGTEKDEDEEEGQQ